TYQKGLCIFIINFFKKFNYLIFFIFMHAMFSSCNFFAMPLLMSFHIIFGTKYFIAPITKDIAVKKIHMMSVIFNAIHHSVLTNAAFHRCATWRGIVETGG
ncbi:hypothetical protein ACDT12_13280, partial [Staphylococcus aureus]